MNRPQISRRLARAALIAATLIALPLLSVRTARTDDLDRLRRQAELQKREQVRQQLLMQQVEQQMLMQQALAIREVQFGIQRPAPTVSTEAQEAGGAALKTDPELDRLLQRADQFARDGRFDLAVVLWQRVLDESGDTVMTREEWARTIESFQRTYRKYRAVADEIERTLAQLPIEGLRMYRLTADGEAKSLLAAGGGEARERALAEVVRRYFLSSHGDEAAFELACLLLDRHEFVGASRLLTKLLTRYPDPTVDKDQVLVRLAVANARVGDKTAAYAALKYLEQMPESRLRDRLLEAVRPDVEHSLQQAVAVIPSSRDWHLPLGGPSRHGHMLPLPADATSADLSELWSQSFETKLSMAAANINNNQQVIWGGGGFFQVRGGRAVILNNAVPNSTNQINPAPGYLLQRWKKNGWVPAGQLLFDDGYLFYKSDTRLVCRDAQTGELKWMSAWENHFDPDPVTQMYARYGGNQAGLMGNRPVAPAEVFLFGDRVHQSMTIVNGEILSIEGRRTGEDTAANQVVNTGYPTIPRRARRNWLAAFDVRTGKARWYRSASRESGETKIEAGFLAAPVPYANMLIAPVTEGGEIWLTAMRGNTPENYAADTVGETVWRTYLCDEPEGGCSHWSPMRLSVDGGDVYASTGAGAVFAVDAMAGRVRWALRYERRGKPNPLLARYGNRVGTMLDVQGWEEDVVIPHGRALVVMPSDSDQLFAVDRRSGEFLWDSPRTPSDEDSPAEYCLGVVGDALYVAGRRVVRQYDIPSGRLMWQTDLSDQSFGRGVLTDDAIYVPVKDSVVRLDPASGKRQQQVGVITVGAELENSDDMVYEPVGNLYSDGNRLIVLGLGRVYALTDLNRRLNELQSQIEAGDGRAQIERMRIRNRRGETADAVADLRGAYALILKSEGPVEANTALYGGMNELSLAAATPQLSLRLLAEATAAAKNVSSADRAKLQELGSRHSSLLLESLKQVEEKKLTGTVAEILAVAPACSEAHELNAARQAIVVAAESTDGDTLKAALESPSAQTRMVAVAALTPVFGKEADPLFEKLLGDDDDGVQLEAAIALANRGNRKSLPALAKLLDSEQLAVRHRSGNALRSLTGKQFGFSAYGDSKSRSQAAENWREWVAANAESARLTYPVKETPYLWGRTLVGNVQTHQVQEFDAAGKQTWAVRAAQPYGVQGLSNGHRLVASFGQRTVTEYAAGDEVKALWTVQLPSQPFSVEGLENGNVLVACYATNQVLEIKPQNQLEIVWQAQVPGNPSDARRLKNGNTLVCLMGGNKVVEVNPQGQIVWQANNISNPRSAQRLENGNTLVAESGRGQVVELDRNGNRGPIIKNGLSQPMQAQRLPNGNTLIAHNRGVMELDEKGQLASPQRSENGVGSASRF